MVSSRKDSSGNVDDFRRDNRYCRKIFSKFKQDRAVAALELAIIMPLLMLILFGIIDWGYVFYVDLSMSNAVREGARVGVTKQTSDAAVADAQTVVANYVDHVAAINEINITANMVDEQLEVNAVIESFQPLIGFIPDTALPSRLATRATMRWELADD